MAWMRKNDKKQLTEEEQYAKDLELEITYQHKKRDYILRTRRRRTLDQAGGATLIKQRKVINIYKGELSDLRNDLKVALNERKLKADSREFDDLTDVLEQHDSLSARVETKSRELNALEVDIVKYKKDVAYYRSIQPTERMWEDRVITGYKHLETYEKQLEWENKKFHTICEENAQLRETINTMLKDRNAYTLLWEKGLRELQNGKNLTFDLIEQATIAYNEREEYCAKLKIIKAKAINDLLIHLEEMDKLQKKDDNVRRLAEFYNTKYQKRRMAVLEEKVRAKMVLRRQKMEEREIHYKEILHDVFEFMESENIYAILEVYDLREHVNFSYFTFILEQNRNLEELAAKTNSLHHEIDDHRALTALRAIGQKEKIQRLRNDLAHIKKQSDRVRRKFRARCKKINRLAKAIGQLFRMCNCDKRPFLKMLGKSRCTRFNVLKYLRRMEDTVQDHILEIYNFEKKLIDSKELDPEFTFIRNEPVERVWVFLTEVITTNPCPLCVEREMVHKVIYELQKAFSTAETRLKLAIRLALPDGTKRVHNVSDCNMPKARRIIQKRYLDTDEEED